MKKLSFTTDGKKKFTKQEIENIKKEKENNSLNFLKLIDEIDITADKYKVILTLGENELIYDDGEFYISETLNENKRRKIARKYAQQMYVDYMMRYHINSDIQRAIQEKAKERNEIVKTKKKTSISKGKDKEKKIIEPKGMAKKIIEEKEKNFVEGQEGKGKKSIEEELEIM